jgi:hypothetical protein
VSGLVIDENLRYSELWNHGHAACMFAFHVVFELARPVYSVEESNDNVTSDGFVNALKSSSTTEEFVQSQASVIIDDLVMRENHKQSGERNASVVIARYQHLFVELVHTITPSLNFLDRKFGQSGIELFDIDLSTLRLTFNWQCRFSTSFTTIFDEGCNAKVAVVNAHFKDAREFLNQLACCSQNFNQYQTHAEQSWKRFL